MRCRRPSATPCAAATPSASSGFELWHDLAPEQLQGAHGVLRREVAEGEDAEKIVRSSFLENLAYLVERGARRSRDERVHRFRGIRLRVVHIRGPSLRVRWWMWLDHLRCASSPSLSASASVSAMTMCSVLARNGAVTCALCLPGSFRCCSQISR